MQHTANTLLGVSVVKHLTNQHAATCYIMLQHTATHRNILIQLLTRRNHDENTQRTNTLHARHVPSLTSIYVLRCVAVCCGVLQCVAVYCSVLQSVAACCSVWQYVAVSQYLHARHLPSLTSIYVLQRVAMCCSVLRYVAVAICCSVVSSSCSLLAQPL